VPRVAILLVNAAGEVHVRWRPRGVVARPAWLEVCLAGDPRPGESPAGAARRLVRAAARRARARSAVAAPEVLCALDLGTSGNRTRVWIFGCAIAALPAPAPPDEAWSAFLKPKSVAALLGSGHIEPTSEIVLRAVAARRKRRPLPARARPSALCDAVNFTCMRCGEPNLVPVDPAGGQEQDLIEDCQTCCAPNRLRIAFLPESTAPAVTVEEA